MWAQADDEVAPSMYITATCRCCSMMVSVGWYEAAGTDDLGRRFLREGRHLAEWLACRSSLKEGVKSDGIDTTPRPRQSPATVRRPEQTASSQTRRDAVDGRRAGHQTCATSNSFVLKAIREDLDLTRHMDDAVSRSAVCLPPTRACAAAPQSSSGRVNSNDRNESRGLADNRELRRLSGRRGAEGHQPRSDGWRIRRLRRPLGLRQVDLASGSSPGSRIRHPAGWSSTARTFP